jgi:hypothetical protein
MSLNVTKFSKKAGLEVRTVTKVAENDDAVRKEGRIMLRAFPLLKNGDPVHFQLNPEESSTMADAINGVLAQGGSGRFLQSYPQIRGDHISPES